MSKGSKRVPKTGRMVQTDGPNSKSPNTESVRRTGEAELLDRGRVGVDLDEGRGAAVELGPRAVDHHLLARAAALPDHPQRFLSMVLQERKTAAEPNIQSHLFRSISKETALQSQKEKALALNVSHRKRVLTPRCGP